MSEYVRTEYGIFELDEFGCIRHPTNGMKIHISYIKDHRVADTIKELCDRFVLRGVDVVFLDKDNTQYRFEGELEWHDITDTEIRIGVYGAIWTDKGLIYVAKMNNQRKFELLRGGE